MSLVRFKTYRLLFTAPLHIGDQREDISVSQETIHSDTLHAALVSCLEKVGTHVEQGELGCLVSDLFPYYQQTEDDEPTFFLPMPLQTSLPQLSDPADAKKVKKVKWVDSLLYSKILQGKKFFCEDDKDIDLIQASYLTSRELPTDANGSKEFVKSEVMQRVKVEDRTGKSPAVPYYVDRITFKDYSGLYFLATGDTTLLDQALKLLEQEGLGTDRNVGYGFFKYLSSEKALSLEVPEDATYQVSLSMFIPESREQLEFLLGDDKVAYDFVRRGGWITTYPHKTLRKNAIYAFLPGSVFCRSTDKDCIGRMVNLQPVGLVNHPVWRNGKSIMLPIQLL